MYKFTTPKHTFRFPETVDPAELAEILITYAQEGRTVLEKRKDDLSFGEDNIAWFVLTQEDTALFRAGRYAEIQVRILFATGESFASQKKRVEILGVLHEGVLEVE